MKKLSLNYIINESTNIKIENISWEYNYLTVYNNTPYIVEIYKGLSEKINDLLAKIPVYTYLTIPLPAYIPHKPDKYLAKCLGIGEAKIAFDFTDENLNVFAKLGPADGTVNVEVIRGELQKVNHITVEVGNTSTDVLNINETRKYLLLVNDSDVDIFVKLGAAAALHEGILLAPKGNLEMFYPFIWKGMIKAIQADVTTKKLLVTEGD